MLMHNNMLAAEILIMLEERKNSIPLTELFQYFPERQMAKKVIERLVEEELVVLDVTSNGLELSLIPDLDEEIPARKQQMKESLAYA